MKNLILISIGICISLISQFSAASSGIGVYAKIKKFERIDKGTTNEMIRIAGTFRTSVGGGGYTPPQQGYMLYKCQQSGKCDLEWADLENSVANGTCVAFGGRGLANGTIRPQSWSTKGPNWYPIQFGVRTVNCSRNFCGL